MLCIDCGSGDTNSYFQQRAPYVWSLGMLPQQSIVHVTEFSKKQVNGRDAIFAGESDFKKEKRKFGMIDLVNDADSATLLTDWQKSFSVGRHQRGPVRDVRLADRPADPGPGAHRQAQSRPG